MSNCLPSGAIHVQGIHLWAHVGVLRSERLTGQLFSLDFSLWLDIDVASAEDDLAQTADYSLAISEIQQLSFHQLICLGQFYTQHQQILM